MVAISAKRYLSFFLFPKVHWVISLWEAVENFPEDQFCKCFCSTHPLQLLLE